MSEHLLCTGFTAGPWAALQLNVCFSIGTMTIDTRRIGNVSDIVRQVQSGVAL
jgi:hypothetical protein